MSKKEELTNIINNHIGKIEYIVDDFLKKNNCNVNIEIGIGVTEYVNMSVGKITNRNSYGLSISPDMIIKLYYTQEECTQIIDCLLHECVHIIAEERGLGFNDGDYDFEKLLYDMHIISNYHGASTAVNIEKALIKEKENNKYLSDLLNIPIDELKEYICERELEIFSEIYYKYIDYLFGDIEEIN
ncbi:hypothetical protein [Terrisporobacter petrolearius]|uniref:hypothetical protein n=1 Tax=Terrisporobacter petrolearius TaxID=1460447 RepID=UPI0022E009D4|nr:hypothetical protein [Terrisporobacter petrolearius]